MHLFKLIFRAILPSLSVGTLVTEANTTWDYTAHLDYGIFQGAYSDSYNLTYWNKIPFAEPPIGINRFRAPQKPARISGIYNSSEPFDECQQRNSGGSEDCLYLSVWGRPWIPGDALRPVAVWFYGGGFIAGGGDMNMPPRLYPTLNVSTLNDFLIVEGNYRLQAFGFLPGKEIAEDPYSDLNPALLDQKAVLDWTRKYVRNFGGDPDNIRLWGQSAGGGSVVAQVLANIDNANQPFHGALTSSPFWPKAYNYDAPQAQWLYDTLADYTNCTGADSLSCLKSVDAIALGNIGQNISLLQEYTTSVYSWAPVIDGTFLKQSLSDAVKKNKIHLDTAFGTYLLMEGEYFIPPGLGDTESTGTPPYNSSEESFDQWLINFLPEFSDEQLNELKDVYPAEGSAEFMPAWNTTFDRASFIYRDLVLACPTYWIADSANIGWLGQYVINSSNHGEDIVWWNKGGAQETSNPLVYQGYAGAIASFFNNGDPNAHKLTNSSEAALPELRSTGEEWIIQKDAFTTLKLDQLPKRCDFWLSVADQVPF